MTERQLQNAVFYGYANNGNLIIVPCSEVFGWEADVVVVTRALFTHEFEIKLTHADFLADKKKTKFEHFQKWMDGERTIERQGIYSMWREIVMQPPNYFWYLCPADLIKSEEVPPWAGLAYAGDSAIRTVKRPHRIHTEKLPVKSLMQLCRTTNWRYWNYRLNFPKEEQPVEGEGV